ncbi:MAG: hypothetical protein Q8Q89_00255 [bacterium]|nr:hypothetical protein [bacterium]
MVVVLQNHLTIKAECLPIKPREEIFTEALVGMGISKDVLEYMVIVVEVRRMIPKGIYGGRNNNVFRIVVDDHVLFTDKPELNKTIAHELKHLATAVSRPHYLENSHCVDGFYFGRSYKWEEINCKRAEECWGHLEFFTFDS